MRMRYVVLALLLVGCAKSTTVPIPTTGPVERIAYDTIVTAKAFLDSEKQSHPECSTAASTLCVDLTKATSAKDALIDALEVYCAGPQFEAGGACQVNSGALSKLQAAIAGYNQTAANVKGAI
jgi:hypothetical protein